MTQGKKAKSLFGISWVQCRQQILSSSPFVGSTIKYIGLLLKNRFYLANGLAWGVGVGIEHQIEPKVMIHLIKKLINAALPLLHAAHLWLAWVLSKKNTRILQIASPPVPTFATPVSGIQRSPLSDRQHSLLAKLLGPGELAWPGGAALVPSCPQTCCSNRSSLHCRVVNVPL